MKKNKELENNLEIINRVRLEVDKNYKELNTNKEILYTVSYEVLDLIKILKDVNFSLKNLYSNKKEKELRKLILKFQDLAQETSQLSFSLSIKDEEEK